VTFRHCCRPSLLPLLLVVRLLQLLLLPSMVAGAAPLLLLPLLIPGRLHSHQPAAFAAAAPDTAARQWVIQQSSNL
jgi:hypothetical protein